MEGLCNLKCIHLLITKIIFSLLFAGVTYFIWMGIYILAASSFVPIVKTILWIMAPITTAIGFTAGLFIHGHISGIRKDSFLSVFVWPLLGCSIGATVIFWYGPMLIVFGIFGFGTASIILRDVFLHRKEK